MAEYLGQMGRPTPSISDTIDKFTQAMDARKAQKIAMAQALIASGQYQPSQPGTQTPPQSLWQRIGQGMAGPTLGGQNMNVGGQNYQYQDPATKMANLKKQLQMIQDMNAQQPQGGSPMAQDVASGLPGALPNYQISPGDIDYNKGTIVDPKITMTTLQDRINFENKQLENKKDQLEIDKAQREEKAKQDADRESNELNTLTPEAARIKLQKENPAEAKFLEDAARGQQTFKGRNNAQITQLKEKAGYLYGLNQQDIDARGDVYKDFHSGKAAQTTRSLNAAINHLFELNTSINNLNNSNYKPFNYVVQGAKENFGGLPPKMDYDTASHALAGELSNIYKTSGATDNEIAGQMATMRPYSAKNDQKQGVRTDVALMLGKIDAFRQYHYDTFNKDFDKPIELLNPQTRQRIKRMGMQDLLDEYDSGDPYKQNLEGRQEPQEQSSLSNQPQKVGKYTFTVSQ